MGVMPYRAGGEEPRLYGGAGRACGRTYAGFMSLGFDFFMFEEILWLF